MNIIKNNSDNSKYNNISSNKSQVQFCFFGEGGSGSKWYRSRSSSSLFKNAK